MSTLKCQEVIFFTNKTDGLVCNYLESRSLHLRFCFSSTAILFAFKTVITAGLLFLAVIGNQ